MDPGGGFVIVWASIGSSGSDTDSFSVQGQRFGADGSPVGDEFQINTFTTTSQISRISSVATDARGKMVVVWDSGGSFTPGPPEGSATSIQGQRYILPLFVDGFESGDTSAWSTTVPTE